MAEEKEERAAENTTVHKSNMCISCIALQCIEVAGWWRCEWTTTGASAARVVKCAAGVVRELADVDQFLHNCALVPQVNHYVSAECAMLCPHPCTTFPPNTRCAGCG